MKQCPECKKELQGHLLFCPYDGTSLISPNEKDKRVGTILEDKYRLDEKVGEGGMGTVYRGTHLQIENTVAIKVLHQHLASDQTALERFRREARAAAFIRHPNAVAVTDFGVTKDTGVAYLVMEFLEGMDVRLRIKARKQLSLEESFFIVHQTCLALYAAHAKGIVHRDLKPDNIWLSKTESGSEQVKVLDFGIAKLKTAAEKNALTQQGMIIGTPYYMSPEQCRGEDLDARSDIYSLGIIVYEMLTGQVPFQAPTSVGIVLKHNSEPPRPPRELRPELPEAVEKVVLRALNKKREERPSTALEFAQEFENALRESGVEIGAPGTSTPQVPWRMTYPAIPQNTSPTAPPSGVISGTTSKSESGRIGETIVGVPFQDVSVNTPPNQTMVGGSLSEPGLRIAPERRVTDRVVEAPPGATDSRRKFLLIGIAAAVVVGVIVGIIIWSRSGPVVGPNNGNTANGNANRGPAPQPPPGMVYVPSGTFTMGFNGSAAVAERPEHKPKADAFFIDQYEVTLAEYYKFVKDGNRRPPRDWPQNWKDGNFSAEEGKRPVTNVTWQEAREYATALGKRLPTEVEWEYAARGTDERLYPWGRDFNPNYANVKESGIAAPRPVGSYPNHASPFQVFDMAGNALEWTESDPLPYPDAEFEARPGKIVRGGSYFTPQAFARTYARVWLPPNESRPDLGFRCAKDIN